MATRGEILVLELDRDTRMRLAAIDHVKRLGEVRDHLTREDLGKGFQFEGARYPLVNPQRASPSIAMESAKCNTMIVCWCGSPGPHSVKIHHFE